MKKRLAIIGGGPIGIEAAALAEDRGFDVTVLEAETIGANVRKWGHVRLFSPWTLNRSTWGNKRLNREYQETAFPLGREYLAEYLVPLANSLRRPIHEGARVSGLARKHALKGEHIYKPERDHGPFLLHVVEGPQESYIEADFVIDTSGVYSDPARLGPGGLPALGESAAEGFIERWIPDPLDTERNTYANKRVVVVGAGYSAVTSLKLLANLKKQEQGTQISWLVRDIGPPYTRIENDSLPERDSLAVFGNDAAAGKIEGITPIFGATFYGIRPTEDGAIDIEIEDANGRRTFVADRVVSNVGYRPDPELSRELQFHQCWASEGPMKLAATLLAQAGGAGDCLQQVSAGVDVLKNPEPNFFVLGSKSYGRNSTFLIRVGIEQVEEILNLISD